MKNTRYCIITPSTFLREREGFEETIKSCDQIAPRAVRSILWKMYSVLGLSSTVWIIERTAGSRVQINSGLVPISRRWQSHAQGSIRDNNGSYPFPLVFLPAASYRLDEYKSILNDRLSSDISVIIMSTVSYEAVNENLLQSYLSRDA